MRKSERHELIKKIIHENPIRNQNQLMEMLKQAGVSATQATISRDIRDLKIVKSIDSTGEPRFELFQSPKDELSQDEDTKRLIRMIEEVIVKVDQVQFMTIIHTLPDNAHLFASVLDDIHSDAITATLASFDTIIVISKTEEQAASVVAFLNDPLNHSL